MPHLRAGATTIWKEATAVCKGYVAVSMQSLIPKKTSQRAKHQWPPATKRPRGRLSPQAAAFQVLCIICKKQLAGSLNPGCHPNIWRGPLNSQQFRTYNGYKRPTNSPLEPLQNQGQVDGASPRVAAKLAPAALAGGDGTGTRGLPLRDTRSSAETPSPGQDRRAPPAGVTVGVGARWRRRPMDALLGVSSRAGPGVRISAAAAAAAAAVSPAAALAAPPPRPLARCTWPPPRLQTASSLFSLSVLPPADSWGFPRRDFPGTWRGPGARSRWSPAARGRRRRGRPDALRPAPSPPRPASPDARETPAPRPGVSPRESPGHFGSWTQRHIHVEIAVMGTGNEIGSFSQPLFCRKSSTVENKKGNHKERKP